MVALASEDRGRSIPIPPIPIPPIPIALGKKPPAYTPRRFPPGPVPEPRVTEFYRQYLAVAVFVVAAFAMVGAMLGAARLLRPTNPQDEKYITYESGSDPLPLFGQANVRYYVYALLFVIFDVEAVFIFPWAINVDGLGWFGLVEMTIFIAVLLLGLAYVWRKGLLKWA
jgi:NADH-quinone oxidoreductase subunit A